MLFETLCEYYDRLEKITGKIEMTKILADLFRKADPNEIDKIAYLTAGELWPEYLGHPELGIAERMALRAISKTTGLSVERLEKMLKTLGDLGRVAERAIMMRKVQALFTQPLTVKEVYEKFVKIAHASGPGSQDLKLRILTGLLVSAKPIEARYIMRIAVGQLRLGVGEMTILDALAEAFLGTKERRAIIEKAYNKAPDIGFIAKIVALEGEAGLKKIKIEPGRPIRPMLAERLQDPAEILRKLGGEAAAEWKFDGERCQIHKKDTDVLIFSRRLENITYQYPDVVDFVKKFIKANEAIVEGEIVAIDPETGDMKPFQELMHRKRKYDIYKIKEAIPLHVYLFDVMYLEGENIMEKIYEERRKVLSKVIPKNHDLFKMPDYIFATSPQDIQTFFDKSVQRGLEGIMAKDPKQPYIAGARKFAWIKLKKSYGGLGDTIDAVVLGYYLGKGRRAEFEFGGLLIGVYNSDKGIFESVARVGSGFTEDEMKLLKEYLEKIRVEKKPNNVDSTIEPDFWVIPKFVVVVTADEITLSPMHTCAKDYFKGKKGFALRFPRVVSLRSTKGPYDATTSKEVYEMYKMNR